MKAKKTEGVVQSTPSDSDGTIYKNGISGTYHLIEGERIIAPESLVQEQMVTCQNCGEVLHGKNNFCMYCGIKL